MRTSSSLSVSCSINNQCVKIPFSPHSSKNDTRVRLTSASSRGWPVWLAFRESLSLLPSSSGGKDNCFILSDSRLTNVVGVGATSSEGFNKKVKSSDPSSSPSSSSPTTARARSTTLDASSSTRSTPSDQVSLLPSGSPSDSSLEYRILTRCCWETMKLTNDPLTYPEPEDRTHSFLP